ncbi:MAG: GIY-YIG nuclease family protein [Nitrososphaeria archaeon]|nr:GIY-YIG nuclease family protein [Nitrososphaeria archaeon]
MKGSYVLVLENKKACNIEVGSLGKIMFSEGFYAYIGSMFGPGGLEARIRRYFTRGKRHWHIDYVLDHMRIIGVYVLPEKNFESFLANAAVKNFNFIKRFGCSDKKSDVSHLLYFKKEHEFNDFMKLINSMGFSAFKL